MSDKLNKNLNALEKATLVDIISEISANSKDGKKLVNMLLTIRDPKAMYKELKKEISAIKRGKRFIDYWHVGEFVARLYSIANNIEKYMIKPEPDLSADLCKRLIEIDGSLFERIDDSSGELGGFYYDLFQILDKSFEASNESADDIVTYILNIVLNDDYGNRSRFSDVLNHSLTEAVIARFIERLEVKPYEYFEKKGRVEAWDEINENQLTIEILKKISDKLKNVDEYIRLCQFGKMDERDICKIAKRLNAAFRAEESITWLNQISSSRYRGEKSKLLQEAYHLEGDQVKEKQVIWERFADSVNVKDYLAYLKLTPDTEQNKVKKQAYRIAVEDCSYLEQGLQFLWDIGDFDAIEETYFSRINEVNGDYRFYRKLSSVLHQNNHALPGVLMRRALVNGVLDSARSKYYRYALNDLTQAMKYSEGLTDWKGYLDHSKYVDKLRETHGRKYSFWDQVV